MSYQPSQLIRDLNVALKNILNAITRPMWVDPTTSRAKTDAVITGSSVTLGTSVSGGMLVTLTTLTNLGTANVSGQFIDRLAWAQTVRARIT